MKKLLLLALNFLLFVSSHAASRYWIASSTANWNDAANWSTSSGGSGGASVPGTSDDVYFNSAKNGNCTIDANVSINGMDIGGYTGTITNTTYSFTVSANNYYTQSSGTFNGGSGTLTFNSRLSMTGGTFNSGSGTVDINGTGFYITGGTFVATTGTMYVNGYFSHQTGGTFTHNNGTVSFDGTGNSPIYMISNVETFYNVTIDRTSGGWLYMYSTNDKILVNGNLNLNNGSINSWNGGQNKILEVLGNVAVASTFTSAETEITLKFSGTATQYFDLTGATSAYNGIIEINKSSGSVILSSNLTMNAGGQDLNLVSGTLDLNSYTITNTTGTTYCTGTFTISGNGTLGNNAWSQTSGSPVLNISGASNFNVVGNFTQSTGTFTSNSAIIDINGNFNLSGGTYTAPSGNMYISGNFNHNTAGTFTHNSGTVSFDGTGNPVIYLLSNTETFYNVIINKTSGGGLYFYYSNDRIIVNGTLTFTCGNFNSWSNYAGYIEAKGNVVFQSTFGTSWHYNVTLVFGGTANQNFDLTGATSGFNGPLQINKSAGAVSLLSNLTMDASSQTMTFTSGTLNLNSYSLVNSTGVTYCTGTFTVSGTGTLTNYSWSQTSGLAAFDITGASNFTINGNLAISNGSFSAGTATSFDLNGSLNFSGGTFTATSGTMYISGNFNHNTGGTFNHNNGTVCFDGTGAPVIYMINNVETFYNLKVDITAGGWLYMYVTNDKAIVNGNLILTNGSINSWNGAQNKIIEVLGNVTVASTFTAAAAEITLKFTGTATQYFDLTGATSLYNGNIEINKSAGSVLLSSNLTMDASGQALTFTSGTLNLNGYTLTNTAGTTNCSGTFTLAGTGSLTNYGWSQTSGSAAFNISGACTFTINSNFAISQGTFSAGSAAVFDVNGSFNFSGGTFTAPSGTMYLSGDWNHNTGGTFNHNNGTVSFDGAVTAVIYMISNVENFYSVTIDKTGGTWVYMKLTNDKAIMSGNLNLNNGFITPWNGGQAKILEVRGDVNVASSFTNTASEIDLNFTGSTSAQTFTFSGTTTRINGNITVNKTSGKVNLGSDVTVYTAKSFTVTAGTLNCLNQVVSGPTFTLASGSTLELGSTGGIASSGATGNIQTTTRTFNTGSYYVYSGISGAQVTGTGLPSTIAGLTINNSAGVSLTASETINTLFTLTSGNLTLGTYDIVMASGSSLSGGSSSSFVYTGSTGFLKFNSCAASSSKTFPVGHTNSSAGYIPLVITFNTGHTTDDFSVIAVDKVTNDGTRNGTAYTSTVVKSMWFITETTSGGSNVNMQFQWNTTDEASGFDRSICHMSHYTNSSWDNPGSNGSASGSNPYTFTYNTYTGTFSPFGMGGSGGPLPVKLLYFKAKNQNGTSHITWATASEINNDYFNIEKSKDGKNFETIGKINGAGNSQQILKYAFIDSNLASGINYYRLKQTDYNGEFSYSDIEIISDYKENKIKLSLYPVPAVNNLNVELNSKTDFESKVRIINMMGTSVFEKNINIQRGNNLIEMNLTNLTDGIYFIQVEGLEVYKNTRFVIKK